MLKIITPILIGFAVIMAYLTMPKVPEYTQEATLAPIEEIVPKEPKQEPMRPNIITNGLAINLTKGVIAFMDKGDVVDTVSIAYQAREGNWFQTPTGYFQVGAMNKNHRSSLTGVNMPYAVQIYEDFFMHEIPFFDDGVPLTSAYTGGCIRNETEDAKKIFEFVKPGMPIVVYKEIEKIKDEYTSPVNPNQFWIKQNFNNPIRQTHKYGGNIDKIRLDYYQHTGVDFAPLPGAEDLEVYAIA